MRVLRSRVAVLLGLLAWATFGVMAIATWFENALFLYWAVPWGWNIFFGGSW